MHVRPPLLYLIKNTHGELIVLVYHLQTHHKGGVPEGSSVDGEEEPQLLERFSSAGTTLHIIYIQCLLQECHSSHKYHQDAPKPWRGRSRGGKVPQNKSSQGGEEG